MATPTIVVEKKTLDGLDSYCIWCFTIANPDGFNFGDEYALDFPSDTKIMDPKRAKKIKGAPPYTLDAENGRRITRQGQTELEICFVATCEEREDTNVSLERRRRILVPVEGSGSGMVTRELGPWERVPWEDAPRGVGPMMGPAAIASSVLETDDRPGVIASYEAAKMAVLLGYELPPSAVAARSLRTCSKDTVFVSSLDSWTGNEPIEEDDKPFEMAV